MSAPHEDPNLPWLNDPPNELPPVEAPSASLVVQLFIIPLIIVAVLVVGGMLVYLPFGRLAGTEQTAVDYVRAIRTEPTDRQRFRAAFELATLIHNESKLAENRSLLAELTSLLADELKKPDNPEIKQYLALTLGSFRILDSGPAGATKSPTALEVLAKCLDKSQPAIVRQAASESLARQAARLEGKLEDHGIISALTEASLDPDTEVRLRAVYALGFMGGEEAERALVAKLSDEDRYVCYNAATALAHRDNIAALPLLREMLDTTQLRKVLPQKVESDLQNKIETIQIDVLRSLYAGVRDGKTELAGSLRPEIKSLTKSKLAEVRNQAEVLLKALTSR